MKNYLSKIIKAEQIVKLEGKFPRQKNKLSMCHGVFDLVHPGHIRHLSYAKSMCDKLIVSITSDIHVTKAELRPYVPEKLRAENLAALEFVDYVIIDENETPSLNLKKIKPDYFVKIKSVILDKSKDKNEIKLKYAIKVRLYDSLDETEHIAQSIKAEQITLKFRDKNNKVVVGLTDKDIDIKFFNSNVNMVKAAIEEISLSIQ